MNTDITITLDTGDKYTFTPQPDITALEAAHWAQLLFCVPHAAPGYNAWEAVERLGLARHFTKQPAPELSPLIVSDPQGFIQPVIPFPVPPVVGAPDLMDAPTATWGCPICKSCSVDMEKSTALLNGMEYSEDFGGDAGQPGSTGSRTGTARMVEVWKCPQCGFSRAT